MKGGWVMMVLRSLLLVKEENAWGIWRESFYITYTLNIGNSNSIELHLDMNTYFIYASLTTTNIPPSKLELHITVSNVSTSGNR